MQIQTLTEKMRRIIRVELEHIHEHLDQVENARIGQLQPIPQIHKRERAPARGEIDDDYRDEYEEADD